MTPEITPDGNIMIRIPIEFRRQGGRKKILAPSGEEAWSLPAPGADPALLKALARAHRWLRMIEGGDVCSAKELAEKERVDDSYLARVLRLTTLAPSIVAAILEGKQPDGLSFNRLTKPFPLRWDEQEAWFGFG